MVAGEEEAMTETLKAALVFREFLRRVGAVPLQRPTKEPGAGVAENEITEGFWWARDCTAVNWGGKPVVVHVVSEGIPGERYLAVDFPGSELCETLSYALERFEFISRIPEPT
jgi:hypothetical protein